MPDQAGPSTMSVAYLAPGAGLTFSGAAQAMSTCGAPRS